MTRIRELDALRGLAALAVVGFHVTAQYTALYGGPALPVTMPWGHYGVEVFFVISGFVIPLTMARCATWRDFAVARITRIYPTYAVCVLLSALVTWAALPSPPVTWAQVGWNLTLLQTLARVSHVDGVYWSLWIEVLFYDVMMGAAFPLSLRPRAVAIWWAGVIALTFVVPMPLVLAHLLRLYGNAGWFLLGIAGFEAHLAGWVSFRGVSWLVCRPILWLGAISYPLYLIHQHLSYAVMFTLLAHGIPVTVGAVVAVALSLVIAWGLHVWVENPAMWITRGLYARWTIRQRAAARRRAHISYMGERTTSHEPNMVGRLNQPIGMRDLIP